MASDSTDVTGSEHNPTFFQYDAPKETGVFVYYSYDPRYVVKSPSSPDADVFGDGKVSYFLTKEIPGVKRLEEEAIGPEQDDHSEA